MYAVLEGAYNCNWMFVLDDFKKMYKQKFKEMEKAYEKQVSGTRAVCVPPWYSC